MKFIDIYRNIKGYVTISGEGKFTERFINICMHREFDIWNIHRCGEEKISADMGISDFKSIRPLCRRTKTRVRITATNGLPFFMHRYRKRRLALIGVILAAVILWYTSGHIMGITIFGNEKIPTETILENLARSGVELGKSTSNIESSQIRNRMMRDMDDLAWIGINVKGSRVYIEVVERIEKENVVDVTRPCNLVASKDGVIEIVEARNGQTMVTLGSGVRQGDVLVSGIMDAGTTGIRYVHAYGEVFAKTTYSITREYSLEYDQAIDTGKQKTRWSISVLNKDIPLYFGSKPPYTEYYLEKREKEYSLPVDILPSVYVKTEVYKEQYKEKKHRTGAEALETAEKELEEELKNNLEDGIEIVDREITHTLTERGGLKVTYTIICRENIAREAEIEEIIHESSM